MNVKKVVIPEFAALCREVYITKSDMHAMINTTELCKVLRFKKDTYYKL